MQEKESAIPSKLADLPDNGIRHVMLINERGRIESMISKSEIHLPKEKQEIFSMGFRLHHSLLQEFDDEFGPVEQFVICRKMAKIVSIPLGPRSLIFIMDNRYDLESVIGNTEEKIHDLRIQEMISPCAEAVPSG